MMSKENHSNASKIKTIVDIEHQNSTTLLILVCIRVFRQQKNRRSKVSHVARCRALHSQARGRTYIVRTTVGPNDKNPPKIRLTNSGN